MSNSRYYNIGKQVAELIDIVKSIRIIFFKPHLNNLKTFNKPTTKYISRCLTIFSSTFPTTWHHFTHSSYLPFSSQLQFPLLNNTKRIKVTTFRLENFLMECYRKHFLCRLCSGGLHLILFWNEWLFWMQSAVSFLDAFWHLQFKLKYYDSWILNDRFTLRPICEPRVSCLLQIMLIIYTLSMTC